MDDEIRMQIYKEIESEQNKKLRVKPKQEPETKHSPARCPYPLTVGVLFRLALSMPDPARNGLGYHYEAELRRECGILIPFPIYRGDQAGLMAVCWKWYQNPVCFPCRSIGSILSCYAMEADSND